MRILIVAAVAALTAIVVTFLLAKLNTSWSGDSSIRTGIVGACSALVAMAAGRSIKKS